MTGATENFNLLIERWIPVLMTEGTYDRVGIFDALTNAGEIRQIAASNPMDNVSLLRLLLTVLQWCNPVPTYDELTEVGLSGGIPLSRLQARLGTRNRPSGVFELFGKYWPVGWQLNSERKLRPFADLFHEIPGASNIAHFYHTRDHREGACPACIALGLARVPTSITGKGQGNYSFEVSV